MPGPNKVVGNAVGQPQVGFDQESGIAHDLGVCKATALTTAGTATLTNPQGAGGVYYGVNCISTGTAFAVAAYDINGTNTKQLAALSTAAAIGGQAYPAAPGQGVRFNGYLAVVTSGTPGQYNALWD